MYTFKTVKSDHTYIHVINFFFFVSKQFNKGKSLLNPCNMGCVDPLAWVGPVHSVFIHIKYVSHSSTITVKGAVLLKFTIKSAIK